MNVVAMRHSKYALAVSAHAQSPAACLEVSKDALNEHAAPSEAVFLVDQVPHVGFHEPREERILWIPDEEGWDDS